MESSTPAPPSHCVPPSRALRGLASNPASSAARARGHADARNRRTARRAGKLRGDWEFCHTGDLPIAEGVARGEDPVLIVAPTAPHDAAFLMARRGITRPEQLANARIGGVDAAGQFGRAVQALLDTMGRERECGVAWIVQGDLPGVGNGRDRRRLPAGRSAIFRRERIRLECPARTSGRRRRHRHHAAADRSQSRAGRAFRRGLRRHHRAVQDRARCGDSAAAALFADSRIANRSGNFHRLLRAAVPGHATAEPSIPKSGS